MSEMLDYSHYYREWHDESDVHLEKMSALMLDHLGPYLPDGRGQQVLEIGCGMGFAMAALARAGYKAIKGVDIDASQIAACKRRGLDVEQIADLEDYLAGHIGRFGLVVMLDVLEHIPVASQVNVMRAVHASMTPGGRLIVQVPNASSIIAARWLYQDFTHASSFTERSIRFVLNNAHFTEVDVPPLENYMARPSLRPAAFFGKQGRWYLKRWLVRSIWKIVLEVECGDGEASRIPLGPNLMAIADKDG